MIRAGLGHKTGKSMGHVAMSGHDGAIARLADLTLDRKMFLHINNSNPALLPDTLERKALEEAGWQIPADGTEIVL
jgi:pyrroloquinoline quinone biosynthesis protein B